MEREKRRITLFDLGVLTAGAALAMAALRWLYPDVRWSMIPTVMSHKIHLYGLVHGIVAIVVEEDILLMPAVTTLCLTLVALDSPRPIGWRRYWWRPGTLACLLGGGVPLTAFVAPLAVKWLRRETVGHPPWVHITTEWPAALGGVAVFAGWAVLVLTGRWQPSQGWVDRTGRAIGLLLMGGAFLLGIHIVLR